MTLEEIGELAKVSKKNRKDLEDKIAELKSNGAQILECIYYVKINQNCSLNGATEIVVNSSTWKNKKA